MGSLFSKGANAAVSDSNDKIFISEIDSARFSIAFSRIMDNFEIAKINKYDIHYGTVDYL
jgi:hypothetical protein